MPFSWAYSAFVFLFWPPNFVLYSVTIPHHVVFDTVTDYTTTAHGEQSRFSFQIVWGVIGLFPLCYALLGYTLYWLVFASCLPFSVHWTIRLFANSFVASYACVEISAWHDGMLYATRQALASRDVLETNLKDPARTEPITRTWRHTRLSRFAYRAARWLFVRLGDHIGYPKEGGMVVWGQQLWLGPFR
ncbi:hypothetical protein F4804DRAFT_314171 [Jackrogersella minutella]|nr:hypothetical protein F4804DRAFT_314171 [Jackrogersella minutella]